MKNQTVRASRRKYHVIYKTTCLVTGRWYIGMHSTDDLNDKYLGSGVRLLRSVKKHGRENHVREILEVLESRDVAANREKVLIDKSVLQDPMSLNCGPGGLGVVDRPPTTEETCRKKSESMKKIWAQGSMTGNSGKKHSAEVIAKVVAKTTGQKRSDEQKNNLSHGIKQYYLLEDPTVIAARAARAAQTRLDRGTNIGGRPKGTKMTEEQKAAQSARTRGVSLSDAHREALKKPKSRISCIFCKRETTTSHLPRYHGQCI